MEWIDEMRMETPEQIDVDLELAGLGSRFLAVMVDWLFKLVATVVLILVVAVAAAVDPTEVVRSQSYVLLALLVAVLGSLWLGYSVFCEVRWNGQTPGKRVARIRVIRVGGASVDFTAAAIRNLLTVVYLIPVFYVLDAIFILVTSRHQRLGDLAAGTIVIRERAVDLGDEPEDALLDHASPEYVFTPAQLGPLTADDRTVLREFLRRHADMTRKGRSRLARTLADRFTTRTGYPPGDHLVDGEEAMTFLASLFRDLQEFLKHG